MSQKEISPVPWSEIVASMADAGFSLVDSQALLIGTLSLWVNAEGKGLVVIQFLEGDARIYRPVAPPFTDWPEQMKHALAAIAKVQPTT